MKAWLSPSTLRQLAGVLACERDRIRSSLRSLAQAEQRLGESQGEEGAALGSPADVASDLAEQELDLGLQETMRARLIEIDAALHRTEDGRYGICDRCGDGIEVARLRALPWASRCVRCAGQPASRPAGRGSTPSTGGAAR
jgi:DnaK suppressor protein